MFCENINSWNAFNLFVLLIVHRLAYAPMHLFPGVIAIEPTGYC